MRDYHLRYRFEGVGSPGGSARTAYNDRKRGGTSPWDAGFLTKGGNVFGSGSKYRALGTV